MGVWCSCPEACWSCHLRLTLSCVDEVTVPAVQADGCASLCQDVLLLPTALWLCVVRAPEGLSTCKPPVLLPGVGEEQRSGQMCSCSSNFHPQLPSLSLGSPLPGV